MLNERTPVADIVLAHSECAAVLQRHRIDYCCQGQRPLEEACQTRRVDVHEVLNELRGAVAARRGEAPPEDPRSISTAELVAQIVRRHHRYLREALPSLEPLAKKVARVHGEHNPKLIALRDELFDLAELLLPHLDEEEEVLFPALIAGGDPARIASELASMHADHQQMAAVLERLREAADGFTVPDWACTSYSTLFRELQALEADLFRHLHLENHVLMPRFHD